MFNYLMILLQGPPQDGASGMTIILFLGAAFAVIYFLMIRPQSKMKKDQNNYLSNLKKGQKIVTIGGIHGTITGFEKNSITVLIAPKTHVTIRRSCVSVEMSRDRESKDHSKEKATQEKGKDVIKQEA